MSMQEDNTPSLYMEVYCQPGLHQHYYYYCGILATNVPTYYNSEHGRVVGGQGGGGGA